MRVGFDVLDVWMEHLLDREDTGMAFDGHLPLLTSKWSGGAFVLHAFVRDEVWQTNLQWYIDIGIQALGCTIERHGVPFQTDA